MNWHVLLFVGVCACVGSPEGQEDTDLVTDVDADGDGYTVEEDCDDDNADVYPTALEICDEIDNNCDGVIDDDATDRLTFYADQDGDTFGNMDSSILACLVSDGFVEDATDCDDTDGGVNPAAAEECNAVDDDCDGDVDEDCPVGEDEDGDGFNTTVDCDDTDPEIYPGATEYCDGVDSDCDGGETQNQVEWVDSSDVLTDITSIWTAGDAASPASIALTEDGEARICPGTYYVSVNADVHTVTLTGVTEDPADVVLDGGGLERVVQVGGPGGALSVSDLTVANGASTFGANLRCGGSWEGNSSLALDNVVVSGGTATGAGGGMVASYCWVTITDSEFNGNVAGGDGGAIAQYGSDEFVGMTVTDTWFKANSAAAGGALYSEAAGPVGSAYFNMSCTSAGSGGMVGNQASEAGGAAYLNGYAEGSASMKVTVGRPCDFGEEDTVDDNLPEDIYLVGDTNFSSPSAAYSYGDGRTFSCMAAYSVSCSATD